MKEANNGKFRTGLLLAKLQIPAVKPGTLLREKLINPMVNNLDRKLVLITGDAGYGKTTLLAQIRDRARLPAVYVSLEPEDSDLVSFFSCLVGGLEKLQPGLAVRSLGLAERGSDVGQNPRLAMGTLLNELVEKRNEELFILLDDYHFLSDDSGVHQALDYFIDHLPPDIHLVIASRKEPPLPSLPKWRAKRDLAELNREALKFTEGEIQSLLEQFYAIRLSETEIKGLAQKTEGWITGVQLILHAAGRDGGAIGQALDSQLEEHGDLFRYFAGEIFSRESPEMQSFMKNSSVLDIMTPDACHRVLELKNPTRRLSQLAASNLFVTETGDGGYRYHRLFREFLYQQLDADPRKQSLHAKAAEYCKELGQESRAVEHYISAGLERKAVEMIASLREKMINRAQFSTLRAWMERLSPAAFQEFPWLYAIQAVFYKEKGKLEQAESRYVQAEQGLKDQDGRDSSLAYVLYEKSIVLHRKGEYQWAVETLAEADKACPGDNTDLRISILGFTAQVCLEGLGDTKKAEVNLAKARRLIKNSSNNMQAVYIEQKRAILLESAGEKRQAFNLYRAIVEKIDNQYFHLVGSYFHNAAKVALDYGRYDWAEQCLNNGQMICQGYEDIFSESMLEFGYGYLYLFRGNWEEAERHLRRALVIFREMNWTRSVCIALRQMSRLSRYRGDLITARQYLEQMKQQPLGPLDRIAVLLELSLIETADGNWAAARESLDSCREQAVKYFGRMGEIICNLAEAGIQDGHKKHKDASRWLQKAVASSKNYGFDGLLACELRANPELAKLAAKGAEEKAYLLTIPSFLPVKETGKSGIELKAELLGPPHLFIGGNDPASAIRRQALQLLCLLAYHRERGLSRDEIIEAMWPASRPKRAVDNLHLVLYEARHGLRKFTGRIGDKAIIKDGERYRLNSLFDITTDTYEFERCLAASGRAEKDGNQTEAKKLLKQVLGLVRGNFCSGWDRGWIQELSVRYRDLHQKALLKLAALHFRDAELEQSLECYMMALENDIFCEEAVRGSMRIHAAKGELRKVNEIFYSLQKTLRKELKAAPSSETSELYQNLIVER
jgi:LuxR family maltose regulon positive regulatory protein